MANVREADDTAFPSDLSVPDGLPSTSESEEMYLITIAMEAEEGHEGPVPVPRLAKALSVSRVSANEMAKKLATRGLVEYVPYKGVRLTDPGATIARSVLRRRRLWGLFLAEHLGLSPAAADTVACEFEHITPAEVAHRLATFLGDPTVGPQGKPIPADGQDPEPSRPELAITDLSVGKRGEIVRVGGDAAVRSFLEEEGFALGARVSLIALGDDGGCLVETEHGHTHLAARVARGIVVTPAGHE